MDVPWWQTAVFYQIYPRSFAAAGHTGIGDLAGIEQRLDHMQWLGIDALWLSPFYRSPMADFGYDVADYCDVDPMFGSLADFDRLLGACHERGMKLLIDFVPNHTSDEHPWFQASRSSRDDPKRDWYVWRDGTPDQPPNNWIAQFTLGPAWTWDEATEQWYLHLFLDKQPDLNWDNPDVVTALHDVMRFWLDKGVDGFRVDVVQGLGKEPGLPDDPEGTTAPHAHINDTVENHEVLRGLRKVIDDYEGDRVLLGEVYLLSTRQVASYYGTGEELHLAFNFPPLKTPWNGVQWRRQVDTTDELIIDPGHWPTWVLSNHDNPRHRSRYGGSEDRARAALFLLLGLQGSPVLYAGEELGLEDAVVTGDRVVDPGGRDGCRAPIPWTAAPDHGWGVTDAWLPWPPEAEARNAESLRADPGSILHLYRRLLAHRRGAPALQRGDFAWLDAPAGVLAWRRDFEGRRQVVVVNMSEADATLEVTGTVAVASDGRGESEPFTGSVPRDHAVVLVDVAA